MHFPDILCAILIRVDIAAGRLSVLFFKDVFILNFEEHWTNDLLLASVVIVDNLVQLAQFDAFEHFLHVDVGVLQLLVQLIGLVIQVLRLDVFNFSFIDFCFLYLFVE